MRLSHVAFYAPVHAFGLYYLHRLLREGPAGLRPVDGAKLALFGLPVMLVLTAVACEVFRAKLRRGYK